MILYLDTSALVKRYIVEDGSQDVITLIAQSTIVGTTVLSKVEMASALAKAVRLEWVRQDDAHTAWEDFLKHWPSFIRITITSLILERASNLAWQYNMRGYDAVHLATAAFWQETLDDPVILATFDRQLWESAQQVGLIGWPESF